jgi:hypothetical protein
MFDYAQIQGGNRVQIDRSRDANLTKFGIETLYDRYLLPEEGPQDLFARVAMIPIMRSVYMITSPNSGSCRQRPFYPTAAHRAGFPSPAF